MHGDGDADRLAPGIVSRIRLGDELHDATPQLLELLRSQSDSEPHELQHRVRSRVDELFLSVVVTAISFAVPAFTDSPFVIGPAFVVSGAFVVIWNVITVSLRQRIVPNHLLGRVNSAYRLFAWGTQPIGALLGGLIGELLGLRAVFLIAGALGLTLLVTRTVITEEALDRAEQDGAAGAAVAQPG